MRLILLLAALALPAGLVSGCGSEDLGSVSAAEAAAATRDAETARIELTMAIKGGGFPQPVEITAEGVTATKGLETDVTIDFGPVLESFGAGGDGKTRVLSDGRDVFVDPPAVEGLDLPGGATWVTADLAEVAEAAGIDVAGLGELMRVSTEQQLASLEAANAVEKVGEEEIDGEDTVRMKGTVTFDDYFRSLSPQRRARVQKLIDQIAALPGGGDVRKELDRPTPIELWVDGDDRVRRIRQESRIPAQQGVPAGSFVMTMDYTDFGTDLDIDRPEGDEVWDATEQLKKLLPKP
ncbi:MAG TPA: hypothetical protein VGW10_16040 [Solirubrobacteraceae bacterium]|nr:hypothetical protein [Solirubrobacteraceae bacterium]